MGDADIAMRVGSMPCLIAIVKADLFAEALQFVDKISALAGNQIKNRRKHLILITPTIDESLLKNKTVNFNVHIITQSESGMETTEVGG